MVVVRHMAATRRGIQEGALPRRTLLHALPSMVVWHPTHVVAGVLLRSIFFAPPSPFPFVFVSTFVVLPHVVAVGRGAVGRQRV